MQRDPTPNETQDGANRVRRIPLWGCVAFAVLLVIVVFALYRFAISRGMAGAVSF